MYNGIKAWMGDWNIDEYPWLNINDPWYGRAYIGDEYDIPYLEIDPPDKRIAVFYDSEGEEEEFDISDIEDQEE